MFVLPPFRDRTLLDQALTHRSYINENPGAIEHNERLEFLGDALLNFLSGEFLYKRYPRKPEGELTRLRAVLVDKQQLAKFAQILDLGHLIRLSHGTEREGGRSNAKLISSAFEALIGAYFLDANSDVNAVRQYVEPFFVSAVETLVMTDCKSRFQEWALATVGENPKYLIIKQLGPDHAKEFTAEVQVRQTKYGEGKGRSKQEAEKAAAQNALELLGLLKPENNCR
jgi:ribonuclease-3